MEILLFIIASCSISLVEFQSFFFAVKIRPKNRARSHSNEFSEMVKSGKNCCVSTLCSFCSRKFTDQPFDADHLVAQINPFFVFCLIMSGSDLMLLQQDYKALVVNRSCVGSDLSAIMI